MNATAQHHRPAILDFAGLPFVIPDEAMIMTTAAWEDLACALIAQDAGRDALANRMIVGLEARLGVNPAHREALAIGTDAVLRRIREEKRRAYLDQSRRASQLSAPIRDPDLVGELAEVLDYARLKRAEAASLKIIAPKVHRKQIKVLLAQAASHEVRAEELRLQELEQDRLYGDAKEPIILAKLRGEQIEAADVEIAEVVTDEYGARVIHRRGPNRGLPVLKYSRGTRAQKFSGIEHAFLSGHLLGKGGPAPDALLDIGRQWRDAYVIVAGQAGRTGDGGGGGSGPKAPQPRLVEAGEARSIMAGTLKRKHLSLAAMSKREADLLDDVCGRDITLRDISPTRGMVPALQRRLRRALRTALLNMAAAREIRVPGEAARRVQKAHRIIAKVRA